MSIVSWDEVVEGRGKDVRDGTRGEILYQIGEDVACLAAAETWHPPPHGGVVEFGMLRQSQTQKGEVTDQTCWCAKANFVHQILSDLRDHESQNPGGPCK
jgi:hypothetical protein